METVSVAENRFGRVIGVVARNHVLTRLLLAYLVMIVAEFGEWLAVIVYAYIRGGASAAGLVVILQLIPSMLLAPLISADGPGLACTALAGLCLSTPLLAHVRPLRADAQEPGEDEGGLSDLLAAAHVILSRPNTRALIAFPAGAAAIEGAIDLLVVVLAVQILAIGAGAAGYLSAAFGAGGLLGATIAVLFAGRRLALPLAAATLIGGLALGALALASTVLVAVLLLALVGAARTV